MKNVYLIEVAEYEIANKIHEEPAFAWWVPSFLKKRNRFTSKVKSKYWQQTHNYGIEVPKSVKHALELDQKNGDNQWWEAITTEMANVRVSFQVFDGEINQLPPEYQEIKCHMIFDSSWVRTSGGRQDTSQGVMPLIHPHQSPIHQSCQGNQFVLHY